MKDIDIKKIGEFVKSMDGADYCYLEHMIGMRNHIQRLIKTYTLDKKYVCDKFGISAKKYDDFTKGNFNYSVWHMAILNSTFMELEMEALKDKVPVQIACEK